MVETRTNKDGGRMLFRFSSYNNGVSETRAYNNDNTLASIAFRGAPIGSYSYSWDANKNKIAETITGVMSGYSFTTGTSGYDDEDRLTGFTRGTLSQSWSLTSVGDWASFTQNGAPQARTHGPTHELTSVGGSPVTHDTKGNITSKPSSLNPTDTSSLAWDFDNRLDAIDVDGDTSVDVTFQYDALGRRVRKNDIVYALSGQQVVAEYAAGTAATTPTEKYVYASYIDEPVFKDGTGGITYYHRNQQYSVIALTGPTGAITERYAYDAYGNLTVLDASGSPLPLPNSNFNNGYTYTGRRFDTETGDYYYRARYYDSSLGRFCSRDPIGYGDDVNMDAYLRGRVLVFLDPSGMQTQTPTKPVITIPKLGDCWDDSLEKTLEDILGHPPTEDEIKDAKGEDVVIGCRDRRGSKRCGYLFAYKFKCKCDEEVIQRVETKKYYMTNDDKPVRPTVPIPNTQPPIFVENFPDHANSCDFHHSVSTIPPGVDKVCFVKTLTSCCGLLGGKKWGRPVKTPDPNKDPRIFKCSGPTKSVTLTFCFNRNGRARVITNGIDGGEIDVSH